MHKADSDLLPKFYVDFNEGSKSITFFGTQELGPFEDDENQLVFVNISNRDLKKSVLIATNKPSYHQLSLVLEQPLISLSHSKFSTETVVTMILKVGDLDILRNVLGSKLEVTTKFTGVFFLYKFSRLTRQS